MTVNELLIELAKQIAKGNGDKKISFLVREGHTEAWAKKAVKVYENLGGTVTIRAVDNEEYL